VHRRGHFQFSRNEPEISNESAFVPQSGPNCVLHIEYFISKLGHGRKIGSIRRFGLAGKRRMRRSLIADSLIAATVPAQFGAAGSEVFVN
jgi:hypothetical protein